MIRSLEIQNYRSFEHYRVDQLAEVNLFVGKNNSGKSSLLEAVTIALSADPILQLGQFARERDELSAFEDELTGNQSETRLNVGYAFQGPDWRKFGGCRFQTDQYGETSISEALLKDGPPLFNEQNEDVTPTRTGLIARRNGDPLSLWKVDGMMGLIEVAHSYVGDAGALLSKPIFVGATGITKDQILKLFAQTILAATEKSVVEALRIVAEDLSEVHFLPAGASIRRNVASNIIIGKSDGTRLPIGSFGDGMRRLLGISLAFVNAKGGSLAIDEIDSGLHYSVMSDLWRLVLESSERLGTQVFATTHSLDCMRGLQETLRAAPELASKIAVHKVDRRRDHAVTISGDRLIKALDADLELR